MKALFINITVFMRGIVVLSSLFLLFISYIKDKIVWRCIHSQACKCNASVWIERQTHFLEKTRAYFSGGIAIDHAEP